MAKLTESNYVKPVPAEKENPFLDAVKVYTDQGVDTAFNVEFAADDYNAEKLQIQAAARTHGFSAREVASDFEEGSGRKTVKSTFLIRPPRKSKAANGETPAEDDAPEGVAAD